MLDTEQLFEAIATEDQNWILAHSTAFPSHVKDDDGNTVITMALHQSTGFLESLLSLGFCADCRNSDDTNPLYHAVLGAKLSAVELLLKFGARINAGIDGDTALHLAARNGDQAIVKLLLKNAKERDCDKFDYVGMTPLMCAIAYGHVGIGEILLDCNCDLNACDVSHYNETALHLAAQFNSSKIYRQLVDRGACEDIKNLRGLTPMDIVKNGPYFNTF